ncbi:hypothetical protein FRC02_008444 [Tulasnella sp. 418]|nr:hypothetical protein FRC02_008444 [Tulasnella sp. 418]
MSPSSSRSPPSLNYLVIFNPTLTPEISGQEGVDEDDAIEQSHILFYTSREQAVSRDRMLRQVGLAKALINFAEMFTSEPGCDSIHSQRKRMIMISPEPNYWIHASLDVPKLPKPPPSSKDKKKKPPPSSKGKEKETSSNEPAFDYQEQLFLDEVLKAQLRRGYDLFKLLHGSFESIRLSVGTQSLERLLERFFSIWASKWDITNVCDSPDFGRHLGHPLHQLSKTSESILNSIYDAVPNDYSPLLIWLHHQQPTTSGTVFQPRCCKPHPPQALIEHLISIIPPPPPPISLPAPTSSSTTIKESKPAGSTSSPLKLPNISLPNLHLGGVSTIANPKNWGLSGYFTIGKSSGTATPASASQQSLDAVKAALESRKAETKESSSPVEHEDNDTHSTNGSLHKPTVSLEVDRESLMEAMSNHGGSSPQVEEDVQEAKEAATEVVDLEKTPTATRRRIPTLEPESAETHADSTQKESAEDVTNAVDLESSPEETEVSSEDQVTKEDQEDSAKVEFLSFSIFVDQEPSLGSESSSATEKRKVEYTVHDRIAFAMIHPSNSTKVDSPLSEHGDSDNEQESNGLEPKVVSATEISEMLKDLVEAIEKDMTDRESHLTGRTTTSEQDQSSNRGRNIVLSTTPFGLTTCSPGFKSTSPHLFSVQGLLSQYDMALEVFSRSTNDQRWYAGKKKNPSDKGSITARGFVEVGRKEASLVDVDRELDLVLRKA